MMKKYLHRADWKGIAGWIWFGIMFFMFLTYIRHNTSNVIDSDMSSEMILARQLSEEGGILSDQWYYSTELRVLSTQLVFAPLFKILGTGYSWHRIRVLGTLLCVVMLMISFYLLCRVLKIKHFQYYAAFLLMPVSYDYFFFMFCNLLYLPFAIITFLTLWLFIDGVRRPLKQRRTIIEMILLFVLSIGAGAGGFREILICYLPLFLAVCILVWLGQAGEKWKWCAFAGTGLAGSGIGLFINVKILSEKYSFWDYTDITVSKFSFSRLESVINSLIINMGFQENCELMVPDILFKEIFFAGWFLLVCCAVVNVIMKKRIYSIEERLVTVFSLSVAVLMTGLYTFTEMMLVNRYFCMVTFMTVPLVTIYLNKRRRDAVYYGIIAGLAINSMQLENTQWSVEPDASDILYQSDRYTLFGFDSYEDVKSHL